MVCRRDTINKRPAIRVFSHRGPGLAAPTAPDLRRGTHFQLLSSRICATDCLGRPIIESHSSQTLTRMFEKVTADLFMRRSRVSKRALTCFLQTVQFVADVSPSCHGACIYASLIERANCPFCSLDMKALRMVCRFVSLRTDLTHSVQAVIAALRSSGRTRCPQNPYRNRSRDRDRASER